MKIETKYNVGDEVFFICGDRIEQGTIVRIDINVGPGPDVLTEYGVYPYSQRISEYALFPTKEALLKIL